MQTKEWEVLDEDLNRARCVRRVARFVPPPPLSVLDDEPSRRSRLADGWILVQCRRWNGRARMMSARLASSNGASVAPLVILFSTIAG